MSTEPTRLKNGSSRKKGISSGAKAHVFFSFYVGAEAPTPKEVFVR
jgi:hypothetical protein